MMYIKFATIALWSLGIGLIAYYFLYLVKSRKAHRTLFRDYLARRALAEQAGEELPEEVKPPKSFLQSLVTSRSFWTITFWLITTSGFMMFIVEESCQVLGFGRYGLQSSKLWAEAADAANYSADFISSSDKLIDIMAIANPFAGYVFGRYMDAEEKKLMWEMQRIEKELEKLGQRIAVVEKQGQRIANELRIRPISPELTTVGATPGKMPVQAVKAGLSYPRQIDYKTQAVRVVEQAGYIWATAHGSKYHNHSCGSLRVNQEIRKGVRKLTRVQAITEGLGPCGRCKPK